MKKAIVLVAVISLIRAPFVRAEDQQACASVLCLGGMLQGQGGGDQCKGPVGSYFNIMEFDPMGGFDGGATSNSRMNFLNGCRSANAGWKQRINDKYGSIQL